MLGREPRIGVCGLNPHAGEHNLFGFEDSAIIAPAVEAARELGFDCTGPHPPDTIFLRGVRGEFDLIVAMYHDQGHIPMKLIDFERTVNISLGIPIIRTSVDHGTAFDIAGQDRADPPQYAGRHAHGGPHGRRPPARAGPAHARRGDPLDMRTADVIVIVVYMAVLVGVGLRFSRRQKSTDEYFLAKRSIPGWAIGMSLLATIITSVTFIAYPGAAYAGDWSLLVPGIMFVVVIAAIGVVVVPFFRHVVAMSAYEYFGKRFGPAVRMYSSFTFAIGHFSKMSFVFYLLALSVGSITGWGLTRIIVILGFITIFYTLIGGLEAVIWTDVIQGFVLWTGVAVTIGLLLFSPRVHTGEMLHLLAVNHKTSLGGFAFNLHAQTFWTMSLYGLFFYLQKYTADQTVVQRYLAATTDRAALRGIRHGRRALPPGLDRLHVHRQPALGVLPHHRRTPSRRRHQTRPGLSPLHGHADAAGRCRPLPRRPLRSGHVHARLRPQLPGVIVVEDFYGRYAPRSTDAQRLRVGKVTVAACGILAIAGALRLSTTQGSALSLYYLLTAIVAGGLAGLFLLAFLVPHAGRTVALIAIAVNLIFTAWATLTMNSGQPSGQPPVPPGTFTAGTIPGTNSPSAPSATSSCFSPAASPALSCRQAAPPAPPYGTGLRCAANPLPAPWPPNQL